MRFRSKQILFVTVLVALMGCKKEHRFPDDPKSTTKSPEERLTGIWILRDFTFKGVSMYNQLNIVAHDTFKLQNLKLFYDRPTKENDFFEQTYIYPYNHFCPVDLVQFDGTSLTFKNNEVACDSATFSFWLLTPGRHTWRGSATWEITKLYKEELNMVLKTDSGEFKTLWRPTQYP